MKIGNLELEAKTSTLVEMLGREGLAGVLLNTQHNFAWLTGGASNGIDLSRENGIATLLVTVAGKRYVISNNIEMPRLLTEQISREDFEPVELRWQDEKADPALLFETAGSLIPGPIGSDIPISPGSRVIEGAVAKCRYRLTPEEILRIRQLGKDAGNAMGSLVSQLVPGASEIEIAEKLRGEIASGGMTSVVTLVAADERIERFRHPVPTENRWVKTLLLVTCAKRPGLLVSLSRIVSLRPIPDELMRKTAAAAFVNASLWNATRPGITGDELYKVAADAYERTGFAAEIDKHHQGGAAGYRTRDWVAHPACSETVQPNQAFAWNPSITGTKVEETGIVGDAGLENVTGGKDQPTIITMIDGREYHSPDIISL